MLTREKLAKLFELTDAVNRQKDIASELLRTAQDRHKKYTHKLMREGKEIELTEKILWDEVFYIGHKSQAGEILQKAHPEVFEAYGKQDVAADELKKFTITELGVDYTQMTLASYLKMTEEIYDLLMREGRFKLREPWWKRMIGKTIKGVTMTDPTETDPTDSEEGEKK